MLHTYQKNLKMQDRHKELGNTNFNTSSLLVLTKEPFVCSSLSPSVGFICCYISESNFGDWDTNQAENQHEKVPV